MAYGHSDHLEHGDANNGHDGGGTPQVFERKRANMRLQPMFEGPTYQ